MRETYYAAIARILADGGWHSARDFLDFRNGVHIPTYAQRISVMNRERGFHIMSSGVGGHEIAAYRMVKSPHGMSRFEPTGQAVMAL